MLVSEQEYLRYVDRAVRSMAAIVTDLGDDLANTRADVDGANSAYALLTHCLGVIEYWAGQINLGRDAHRHRASEFTASGPVAPLLARTEDVLAQLAHDVAAARPGAAPVRPPDGWARAPQKMQSQGAALLHVYEEVAQHLGQLEVLRDVLRREHPAPFEPALEWLRAKRTVKWVRPGPDRIPSWVADMDFPVAPPIRAALVGMLDRGDLGYPEWSHRPLAQAFADRMRHSFGWDADPDLARPVSDLIQGLQVLLHLATDEGDGVLAHVPNYPPFPRSIATMGRRLVPIPLVAQADSWTWDAAALERAASDARVLLLVNPHNPTGRSFTRTELQQLADLADAHDLLVICDEIHAELVHEPHRHVPFATLAPDRTVTITSATKAYNLAGVRTAVAHVGPAWLRQRWDARSDLFGAPNTLGVEATVAAWRDCDDWLAGLRTHLRAQRDHLAARVAELPGVTMRIPDAGYLAWLDCTGADLPGGPYAFFRDRAGVELAPGPDYDVDATGWARLNFATGRAVLDEILDRMAAALHNR